MVRFYFQNTAKILMIVCFLCSCSGIKHKTFLNEEKTTSFSQDLMLPDHFEMDFEFISDTISLIKSEKEINIKVRWINISDKSLWLYPDGYMIITFDPLEFTELIIDKPILAIKEHESLNDKVLLSVQESYERTFAFRLEGIIDAFVNEVVDSLCMLYISPVVSLANFEQIDKSNTPFLEMLISKETHRLIISP